MTTATTTTRSPAIEELLDRHGLSYRFVDCLSDVDLDRSIERQVRRPRTLDVEVVERYAAALEAGVQFPPLVAELDDDGALVLVCGVHRWAASLDVDVALGGYLVDDLDPTTRVRIALEDNARHGKPLGNAERCEAALALIAAGLTRPEAISTVGISQNMLWRHTQLAAFADRVAFLGLSAAVDRLPKSSKTRLATIADDEVLEATAELVAEAGLGTSDVYRLVTQVNQCSDPLDALRLIGSWAEDVDTGRTTRQRHRASRSPAARLVRATTSINGIGAADVVRTVDTVGSVDVVERCKTAARRLMEIGKALEEAGR